MSAENGDIEQNYESERGPRKVAAVLIHRLIGGREYKRGIDIWDLEFLVAQREDGTFTFPGGKYDEEIEGEEAVDGAVRELGEETGVEIGSGLLECIYESQFRTEKDGFIHFSLFTLPNELVSEMDIQNLVDTHTDWEFMSLEQLLEKGDPRMIRILGAVLYVPSHIFVPELFDRLRFFVPEIGYRPS